ncbi:MAG: nuclear transport factor 2 family protein [Pyrinomonadaceae bacterium]
MRQIVILVSLVFALSAVVIGQAKDKSGNGSTEQLILRLENEGREATLKNDLAANDRLLADKWINVNADGSVTTKAKLLELLKAGSFTIQSIENDEVMVRVFGESAVVTGRSTTKRSGEGGEILTRQVRFTRVYAKNHGRWQVVSAQNTIIRQP